MLNLCLLSSGSGGNAVLVYSSDTVLLVDAGISARRITTGMEQLGLDPGALDGIFITHTHSDHISGLPVLLRRTGAPLYATAEARAVLEREVEGAAGRVHTVYPGERLTLGNLEVLPFSTSHDAPGSAGYTISSGGRRCALITDLGFVTEEVRQSVLGAHLAVVETNHDPDWLREGPYPAYLKGRIAGDLGHLSNEDGGALCCELAASGATQLILGHLSPQNNAPERAETVVRAMLARQGLSPAVWVAARSEMTGPFEV